MARSPRSPATGRDVAVVLGVLLALGVLCGVLWWLLWDPAAYTKTADGGVMGETDLSRRFAADGLYAVIAGVAGLLAGLGLTWWRTRDPLLTSATLLVGSVLVSSGRNADYEAVVPRASLVLPRARTRRRARPGC